MAFTYNRAITIDHTKCGSSDSSSFPVLVNTAGAAAGVLSSLKSVANGGHVQSSSGFDVYFYSDAGLTTRLPAERVAWDATTGIGEWWVQIATLSHSADSTIYIAYGDASISTDPNSDATYGKNKVWDSNFKFVDHFSEGTGTVAHDSTSNGVDMTVSAHLSAEGPWAGAGQIGAVSLSGGNTGVGSDYLSNAASASANIIGSGTPDYTIECWIKVPSANYTANDWAIAGQWWNTSGYMIYSTGSGVYRVYQDSNFVTLGTAVPNDGAWHYLVGQKSGGTGLIYVDGALVTSAAFGGSTIGTASVAFDIGTYAAQQRGPFAGFMDEHRVSATARSADWILAGYNNQFIPDKNASASGFYTIGSESGGAAAQVPYQTYYQSIVTQ